MKLEFGGGQHPKEGYTNIDISNGPEVDVCADVRALFTPDVALSDYPILEKFTDTEFATHIRASHFVEHIPWIYQIPMFNYFWKVLQPGGELEIVTPNLDYIVRVYLKRPRWRLRQFFSKFRGKTRPLFPASDHELIETNTEQHDLSLWTNFKLFSGCGLGDYHHCCYDKKMMWHVLSYQSWATIKIFTKQDQLFMIATKKTSTDPYL